MGVFLGDRLHRLLDLYHALIGLYYGGEAFRADDQGRVEARDDRGQRLVRLDDDDLCRRACRGGGGFVLKASD